MIELFIFHIIPLLGVVYSLLDLLALLFLLSKKHCHLSLALLFDLIALRYVSADHNALLLEEFILFLEHLLHLSLLRLPQSL